MLLAGFASMAAYGGSFARDGIVPGLRRVLLRCLHLYLFQALLLVTLLIVAGSWVHNFGTVPEGDAAVVRAGL